MNRIKREHCYKVKDQLIIEGLFVDCCIKNPITNIREQSHICSLNHFLTTCNKWLIYAVFQRSHRQQILICNDHFLLFFFP